MDPQHRLLLECAWEVLENAGYDPERYAGLIGVFAGASINNYQTEIIQDPRHAGASAGSYETTLANEKDFLTTRVSYKLNLKGPSINVQTSCSTSAPAPTCPGTLRTEERGRWGKTSLPAHSYLPGFQETAWVG